jgi:hypothetical protein
MSEERMRTALSRDHPAESDRTGQLSSDLAASAAWYAVQQPNAELSAGPARKQPRWDQSWSRWRRSD